MPYKDKETKRKHDRDYIQERRGTTNERDDGVGTTEYVRPIIRALADPIKREKLRDICQSLSNHNCLTKVYYGYGDDPVRMDDVTILLSAVH